MNIITKLKLKLEAEDEIEYKKKLRKKQAKELRLAKLTRKIAQKEGETEHDSASKVFKHTYTEDDLRVYFEKKKGLSTRLTYEIHYKGERVFYKYGNVQEFKPCEWIDQVVSKAEEIEKEKQKSKNKKVRRNWGLDRECDSEIFNTLF